MNQNYSKKALEDGHLLRYLKHLFLERQDRQTLMEVLSCLRDSEVIVPVRIDVSDEDAKRILSAPKGQRILTQDKAKLNPALLKSTDGIFLPVFSSPEQLTAEYAKTVSTMNLSAVSAIRYAQTIENINGLVLDAFNEPMLIPMPSAELILKMKSHLCD